MELIADAWLAAKSGPSPAKFKNKTSAPFSMLGAVHAGHVNAFTDRLSCLFLSIFNDQNGAKIRL